MKHICKDLSFNIWCKHVCYRSCNGWAPLPIELKRFRPKNKFQMINNASTYMMKRLNYDLKRNHQIRGIESRLIVKMG